MSVEEFVSALLQHLPEKQFKMIRYYGAYARGKKKLYAAYLQSSITQSTLYRFGFGSLRKRLRCPYCGRELKFVCYARKPPPPASLIERVFFIAFIKKKEHLII